MMPSLDQGALARRSPVDSWGRAAHLADRGVLLLVVVFAFLLGCQQLFDADFWWHLRSGQWILENRRVPSVDPFTFASADRAWIDLSWLFQVTLAIAFAMGGVRGAILMTAAVCAASSAVVVLLRDRRIPSWLLAACWLPALAVMNARFVPRPEIFSILWMALYLTILLKVDATPALVWFLPLIQILWVNSHGLFALGPIILSVYLADRLICAVRGLRNAADETVPIRKRWWLHLGGASVLVGVACLVNPYGVRGALFPLELLPKITAWGGLYKSQIREFADLRDFVLKQGAPAIGSLYTRVECLLLWALPPSFVVPAIWRTSRSRANRPAVHVGALIAALALIVLSVLGFPGHGTPGFLIWPSLLAAPAMVVLGVLGAALLVRHDRRAAWLATIGGLASGSSMIWLRWDLFGPEPGPVPWLVAIHIGESFLGWITVLAMLVAGLLVLRAGARPFILLLAIIFSYLALQAIRNGNLFAFVSAIVLTWNLGGWAREMAAAGNNDLRPVWKSVFARHPANGLLVVLLGSIIFTVVTGRFIRATGEPRQFGLGESPLVFAHQAAQFAGQTGMQDRALAYDLIQAGVYTYHNWPQRKVFMDGRLEVPQRETFQTYIRLRNMLNEGSSGWEERLRRLGEPLLLLGHTSEFGAEATLLVHPGWRCVYFDPVASIFVSNSRTDLERKFPTVDFAARHFRDPEWRAAPSEPSGVAEGKALLNVALTLNYRNGLVGTLATSVALSAGHRFRQAIAADPTIASSWEFLGASCSNMIGDLTVPPPGPAEPWDIARGMLQVQASYCFRRALELDPSEENARSSLLRSLEWRGMRAPEAALVALERASGERFEITSSADAQKAGCEQLARRLGELLQTGRFDEVFPCFNAAERQGIKPNWATRDRVATTLLHLGQPVVARRIWQSAPDPPSKAMQHSRIATAALAAQDFPAAREGYESALKLDSALAEPWFGLALLHVQVGEAELARAACNEGLRHTLTDSQAASLKVLLNVVR
jgi:tetratricopeptide (TPR) repeat protein